MIHPEDAFRFIRGLSFCFACTLEYRMRFNKLDEKEITLAQESSYRLENPGFSWPRTRIIDIIKENKAGIKTICATFP
jgi:hypothetical protein